MAIHEVEFKSFNEIETVKGWIYIPIREPMGSFKSFMGMVNIHADISI